MTTELYIASAKFLDDSAMAAYLKLLSQSELAESKRFISSSARLQFIVGRALLRAILSPNLGQYPQKIIFGRTRYGKPYVDWPDRRHAWEFNVSHCPSTVAIVLSKAGCVGVDVETLDRAIDITAVGNYCLSDIELRAYNAVCEPRRAHALLRYWTVKEACTKAFGLGMQMDLREVQCCFNDPESSFNFVYPNGQEAGSPEVVAWQCFLSRDDVVTVVADHGVMNMPSRLKVVRIAPGMKFEEISCPIVRGFGRFDS